MAFQAWLGNAGTSGNTDTYNSSSPDGFVKGNPVLAFENNAALRMSTLIAAAFGNRFFSTRTVDSSLANLQSDIKNSCLNVRLKTFPNDVTSIVLADGSEGNNLPTGNDALYRSIFGVGNGIPASYGSIFGKYGVGGKLFAVGSGTQVTPKNVMDIDADGATVKFAPTQSFQINDAFEVDSVGVLVKKSPAAGLTNDSKRPVLRGDLQGSTAKYLHTISFYANADRQFSATVCFVSDLASFNFVDNKLYTVLNAIYNANTNHELWGSVTSAPQGQTTSTTTNSIISLTYANSAYQFAGMNVDGTLLTVANNILSSSAITCTVAKQIVTELPHVEFSPQVIS